MQFGPQLLYSTLVSYLREPMEKAFAALAVLESRVYQKWVSDKENRKPFVPFADLYFINTEFLPLLSSSFLPRMGASGHQLNLSIASVRFSSSFSLPLSWRRISRTAPFSSCSRSASPLSRRPNSPPRSTQNSQSLSPLRSPPRRVR